VSKNTKTNKKQYSLIDITFLLVAPIAAAVLTCILPLNLLESTLLFFGLPAVYISWRRKDIIMRSLIFALAITAISILTDYLAERDQSWVSTSVFHMRVAGSVPIEALVWVFLFTYLILVYYLFFNDHAPHKPIGRRMPSVFLVALAVIVWVCVTTVVDLHFTIEYFYIKSGLAFIVLPLLAFVFSFPRYLSIFLKTAPYFIALGLLNLLVSLHKGYWSYPGQHFIGWVQLGAYRFPVEELVFWILLYSSFLISQFEFFDNDRLKLKPTWMFQPKKNRPGGGQKSKSRQ
jgi:hypothetical protein